MKKNKVNPDRIIQTTEENFKDVLTKPNLKNLGLTNIAKAEKMTINEIARCLPTDVKSQKSKQTRLLRFIDNDLPLNNMMFSCHVPPCNGRTEARFVLTKAYGK